MEILIYIGFILWFFAGYNMGVCDQRIKNLFKNK